jgi:hypothetical protein
MASVTSSTEFSMISWMNEMFLYSPEAMREMTSRLVISGSTTRLAAAASVVDHHDEITA